MSEKAKKRNKVKTPDLEKQVLKEAQRQLIDARNELDHERRRKD